MQSRKQWLAILVLTALFLSSLTGCYGSASPKPVKVCPPGTLQQERPIPAWTGRTWGDLAKWGEALAGTIDELNADNRAAARFCNTPFQK